MLLWIKAPSFIEFWVLPALALAGQNQMISRAVLIWPLDQMFPIPIYRQTTHQITDGKLDILYVAYLNYFHFFL